MERVRHHIGMKEIGAIVEVHGPVVHIRCDTLPPLQQALVTQNGKSLASAPARPKGNEATGETGSNSTFFRIKKKLTGCGEEYMSV